MDIENANLFGERIDLPGRVGDPRIEFAAQLLDSRRQTIDVLRKRLACEYDQIAERCITGAFENFGDRIEEAREGRAHVVAREFAQQPFKVLVRFVLDLGAGAVRAGIPQPFQQELVDFLDDAIDLNAEAES
jgi:hypothetical protein